MQLFTYKIDYSEPIDIFAQVQAQPYSLFFDSADRKHAAARFSFIAFEPFETIEAKNGDVTITRDGRKIMVQGDPFDVLKNRLVASNLSAATDADLPPFQGGAAGFFGYELARGLEKLPAMPISGLPDMAIGLYDQVVAFDHCRKKSWLFVHATTQDDADIKEARFRQLMASKIKPPAPSSPQLDWQANFSQETYQAAVQRVIGYIYDGDIFQANLSQCFSASRPKNFDAFVHYTQLRAVNPAPFASYMNFGDFQLASMSPERFLRVRGREVMTQPIKGTRRRDPDLFHDSELKSELQQSEKDRAENIMIVDLLRNDLSRVCEDFSIEVPKLCELETFASVHHLVSTVRGDLRPDQTAMDALRACFPGGSITGAPKIRAMEIIAEIEDVARGPYCGVMGYVGFSGAMDTNIAIRTLVYEKDRVRFNVGGGITAGSIPQGEYQETLDKAAAIFKSFAPDHCANSAA